MFRPAWKSRRWLNFSGVVTNVALYSQTSSKFKTGIIMVNMGGPQTSEHVHDFLLRLFSDRELLQLPAQSFLSRVIAKRRAPKIIQQYNQIGGGSPITHWTRTQGDYLIKRLNELSPQTAPHKFYIGFRYVHPLLENAINELEKDGVERVVAFSQYPQYSCTTTGSSFNAIARHYGTAGSTEGTFTGVETVPAPSLKQLGDDHKVVWSFIDRWPVHGPLLKASAQHIQQTLNRIEDPEERRNTVLLFSAHSIPMSVVNRGDAYPQEVAATVHGVMKELKFANPYRLVWQSKVGPTAWLGPSTELTLHGLGKLGYRSVILVPITFTSDHIETLYEMDVEYCDMVASKAGTRVYRAPALNDNSQFLLGQAELVAQHLRQGELCSRQFLLRCPMCTNPSCGTSRDFILSHQKRLDNWTQSTFQQQCAL